MLCCVYPVATPLLWGNNNPRTNQSLSHCDDYQHNTVIIETLGTRMENKQFNWRILEGYNSNDQLLIHSAYHQHLQSGGDHRHEKNENY